jgi:hypothetical protein
LIAILTAFLFGLLYPLSRSLRTFWAWATGTESPKEKMVVFLPLNLIVGFLIGGFAQTFYGAGAMCYRSAQPLVPCTLKLLSESPPSS